MIKLRREREPSVIGADFHGDGRRRLALELLRGQRSVLQGTMSKHKFKRGIWKKAKKQLKRETAGKCAYCEADTAAVAHGDVEHYRPKSKYWWLAYCYDNYLFSCQLCNQSFKSNHFPVHGAALSEPAVLEDSDDDLLEELSEGVVPDPFDAAAVKSFLAGGGAEQAGIPDPYAEDPEAIFAWEADDVLEEVVLVPRDDQLATRRKVEAAEELLGLNRDELRRLRWKKLDVLRLLRAFFESDGIEPAKREKARKGLVDLTADDADFAGMSRHFVHTVWQLDLEP